MANHNSGKGLAWAALIVAIVALVLAWTAFNRTGTDLDQRIESSVEETVQEIQDVEDVEVEVESEGEATTTTDSGTTTQ